MFADAKQAEIIRSNQKDDFYSNYIKSSLAEIVQDFFGARVWLRWRQELDLVADLGYFGLTTCAGFQTLGEEYVNMIQVDETLRKVPSFWRRGFMILLQVTAPYMIDRCLSYIEKQLRVNPPNSLTPEARTVLLKTIPVVRHTVTILHRCHLALFYMKGIFYHIAKRFTNIHYILVRDGGTGARSGYRILGWLSVIQLAFTLIQNIYNWSLRQNTEHQSSHNTGLLVDHQPVKELVQYGDAVEKSTDASLKCVLCLGNRIQSTCTPCGHLFCWQCITEWCSNKSECPLCRESFQMSRLIYLQNYDPP
ncbi:hypothetical protein LSH36_172g00007 [Paralvinella palmiformis]|uniref:RING-type E3 ubiquitin transferase n=1 Tax=Paralvinella palmiformis TaxID=53620 RepID=A0AAD9JSG9_9ANNE|nr:hypothetical protein LSH36_172g00007 [Paralvinella palmiformis]